MRKILYLLTDPDPAQTDLLAIKQSSSSDVSVILLQDGVKVKLPGTFQQVYALSDDVRVQNVPVSYPLVSYADLLRMILESDTVVSL